jgi:hypothetical protein
VPSGPLGYLVRVRVNGEGDTREVSVNKACRFIYCGRTSGFSTANAFYEMVDFEVKREGSRWRVTRWLSWAIT